MCSQLQQHMPLISCLMDMTNLLMGFMGTPSKGQTAPTLCQAIQELQAVLPMLEAKLGDAHDSSAMLGELEGLLKGLDQDVRTQAKCISQVEAKQTELVTTIQTHVSIAHMEIV
ncbi:hypothetical protein ACA910_020609 [Epithemia clementina (nom. ined.)]